MPGLLHFLVYFAVKLGVLEYHFHMDYVSKDALVIRGGSKMKKRKRCQIQTPKEPPKEPPKDKPGKMKSHLGEELCYQFAWGTYSPQKVQQLAHLAIQDYDLLGVASTDPSSATVLGGTSKSHSSGTVLGGTSEDPSSGTVRGCTSKGPSIASGTSKHPSSGTSKDPYIELRQLSAIGTCGRHSNNCHRDLMNILEDKSMLPMPHNLAVDMSPSLAF